MTRVGMRAVLLGSVLVALLGGCGGDGAGDTAGGGAQDAAKGAQGGPAQEAKGTVPTVTVVNGVGVVDACKLVTVEEVGQALGTPMAAGAMTSGPTCDWRPVDDGKGAFITMAVLVPQGEQAEDVDATAMCTQSKSGLSGTSEAVEGFGKEAHWYFDKAPAASNATLLTCMDTGTVTISMSGSLGEADLRAAAGSILRAVIGRLEP